VDLVQVDVVRLQAPEAAVDRASDPHARVAAVVESGTHLAVDLRCQDHLVASTLQRTPDDLLRLTGGVDIGRVDEVDPAVERRVDDAHAVVGVAVPPRAEHHRAKAMGTDPQAGAPERPVFHPSPRSPASTCENGIKRASTAPGTLGHVDTGGMVGLGTCRTPQGVDRCCRGPDWTRATSHAWIA
jgi:hypothetical protein